MQCKTVQHCSTKTGFAENLLESLQTVQSHRRIIIANLFPFFFSFQIAFVRTTHHNNYTPEEGETFQVKKTSQSKKVMKTLDKERRRKRHAEKNGGSREDSYSFAASTSSTTSTSTSATSSKSKSSSSSKHGEGSEPKDKLKKEKCENTSSNIQTEIRTDDFVVRLLLFNFLPLSTSYSPPSKRNEFSPTQKKSRFVFYNVATVDRRFRFSCSFKPEQTDGQAIIANHMASAQTNRSKSVSFPAILISFPCVQLFPSPVFSSWSKSPTQRIRF